MMKNTKKNKKIFGFTLAELLLALSIVGIVAAVVLPGIKNIQPDREAIVLKKGYMTLTRTISSMIINDDLYPEVSDNSLISSNFANTAKVEYRGKEYSGSSKFCELFAAHVSIKGGLSVNGSQCTFETTDGIHWLVRGGTTNVIYFNSEQNGDLSSWFKFDVDQFGKITIGNTSNKAKIEELIIKADLRKE